MALAHMEPCYEAVCAACRETPPGVVALAETLFVGDVTSVASFLACMLNGPLVFGAQQIDFHRALVARGGLVDVHGRGPTHTVLYVSSAYRRIGAVAYRLAPLVNALCGLLAGPDLHAAFKMLNNVPGRVAHACLFWAPPRETPPLRAWFLARFLAPGSADVESWGSNPRMRLVQTPEFLDLVYLESLLLETDPRNLSETARAELRRSLQTDNDACVWTHSSAAQRIMEMAVPRQVLSFYSYYLQSFLTADPRLGISSTLAHAQHYWEVCFAMLMGWDVGYFLPVVARLPSPVLATLSKIAEDMRTFLRAPLTAGEPALRAIYARTSDFDGAYMANQGVREMLMKRTGVRRVIELFYVPATEVGASAIIAQMCDTAQVAQLRGIDQWLTATPGNFSIAAALDVDRVAALDEHMFACRLPPGVHVHRARWTFEYFEHACPALLGGLARSAFVGVDENNAPYAIVPRRGMDIMRLLMFADALTLRHYRKTTAVYPLLMRLFLTDRPPPLAADPFARTNINDLSLLCVGHVLAYWLGVPTSSDGMLLSRSGMPGPGDSVSSLSALDRVIALLVAAHPAETGTHMPSLNALRSYLMIQAAHTLTPATLAALRVSAIAAAGETGAWLRTALAALEVAVASGSVAPRSRGRPRAQLLPGSRVTTALVATAAFLTALRRLDPVHPMLARDEPTRVTLLNYWVYGHVLAVGDTATLLDYAASIAPLTPADFKRNKYNCPASVAGPWKQSNDFFLNARPEGYCRNGAVRPQCAGANIAPMIAFLQQLELHVCVTDLAARYNGNATAPPAGSIVAVLTEMYNDPQRVASAMPVSAYYNRTTANHVLVGFDNALCIADVLPSAAAVADPSHNPNTSVMSAGETHPGDIAVDLVTMFGHAFDEERAADPALCCRLYNQALASPK